MQSLQGPALAPQVHAFLDCFVTWTSPDLFYQNYVKMMKQVLCVPAGPVSEGVGHQEENKGG